MITYTPHQNGVAKQMNRTQAERIRAMTRTTGLTKSFCAEATRTACYVLNQSPLMAIEMWATKLVYYSTLNSLGCLVYVMYNAYERAKLDPKSKRCIFLGYANGVNGYRM